MWNTAKDVEQKTLNYWIVSQAWNGRLPEELTTGAAIVHCTNNLTYTHPDRPVHRLTNKLLRELVEGEGSQPNPQAAMVHILPVVSIAR